MVLACRLDRLQHEVPLPSREHQAQPLQLVFPKLHRAPVVQVSERLIARHLLQLWAGGASRWVPSSGDIIIPFIQSLSNSLYSLLLFPLQYYHLNR